MLVLSFVFGLVLLIVGAQVLIRGATRIAAAFGISPLIVGLTVVAFGTSAPEFAVTLKSVLSGQGDIAIGNVIGSNIFNVLFILGLSALVAPLVVSQQLVRLDVPLMAAISVLVLVLGLDGILGRADGLLLFGGIIAYIVFLIRQSRRESEAVRDEYTTQFGVTASGSRLIDALTILGGLALLVVGSRLLVDSAVSLAQSLGVSELVIALTIVAAGTSLPEVVTSIVAAIRGEVDIAVGNVVGSNLFNLMGVLGAAGMVSPEGVAVSAAVIHFDLPIMIVVALACLPIFFTDATISRPEGALFLGYYAAYTAYLVLAAGEHDVLPAFSAVMLYFAIPLTLVTLVVVAAGEVRQRRAARRKTLGPGSADR